MPSEPDSKTPELLHERLQREILARWRAVPRWVTGQIAPWEAMFLEAVIRREKPSLVLEIGTASGYSTAVLCRALAAAAQSAGGDPAYRVVSYDIDERFYADSSKQVGDAAREMLDDGLLAHVEFRNPCIAADAARDFGEGEMPLVFIDANHRHPWPVLDLLAVTDIVRPGGVVVLHDINLPLLSASGTDPASAAWGAHWLFENLDLEKEVSSNPFEVSSLEYPLGVPNIGSVRMPKDKQRLRRQLLEIIHAHPWETDVPDGVLARLLLRRADGPFTDILRRLWRRFRPARKPISSRVEFISSIPSSRSDRGPVRSC